MRQKEEQLDPRRRRRAKPDRPELYVTQSIDGDSTSHLFNSETLQCPAYDRRRTRACGEGTLPSHRHCKRRVDAACQAFQQPTTGQYQQQLSGLEKWASSRLEKFWTVDVEFTKFSGLCPVALGVCIPRFSDDKAHLDCKIDYGSRSFSQVMDIIKDAYPDGTVVHDMIRSRAQSTFNRMYGENGLAEGISFSTMRCKILELGFNDATHALISYGASSSDMQVMWKILTANDDIAIPSTAKTDFHLGNVNFTCMDPVEIQRILEATVTRQPTSFRLADVHRALYGGRPDVDPHYPDADTLLLNDVMRPLCRFR
ncbi:Nn.00g030840.m01.CDS01 [Neocucurbitaria sp. VM-36]